MTNENEATTLVVDLTTLTAKQVNLLMLKLIEMNANFETKK